MASYDRMDWHYDGDYPKHLPTENGGTHIGMFLAWIINNDLHGDMHRQESKESIHKVLTRQWTGRDFLIHECDEKFWEDCLNKDGNEFTKFYYDTARDNGVSYFLEDYSGLFGETVDSIYEVDDTWDNFDKLEPLIDKRYKDWKTAD